jgi:hypothetical protein
VSAGTAGSAGEQSGNGGGGGGGTSDSGGAAGTDGVGSGGGGGSGGGVDFGAPLVECNEPSIDRLKGWNATNEGTMVPQSGTLLVASGEGYAAEVEWLNNEWHVVPVNIGNLWETSVDLTASYGFELTYSSTATIWVQMRSASHWSGGTQYVAEIPSTDGAIQTLVVPFAEDHWGPHPQLGTPTWSYAENLADVRGLVFVGNTPNTLTFSGLRIEGYAPPCQE